MKIQLKSKLLGFGSLLTAGFLALSPVLTFAQEGTLDTTFGGTGYVSTPFANFPIDEGFWDAEVQSDGKIIAAGYTTDDSSSNVDLAVARYNPDGTLDSGFGTGGKVTLDQGDYDFIWDGVAIQADGKIIIAAGNFSGANQSAFIYRLNTNGAVDTSFGNNGVVTFNEVSYFDAVTIQTDGKIVATGAEIISQQFRLLVVRLNTDGSLDTGFGDGGQFIDDLGISYASGEAIRLQSDGRIVISVQYDTLVRLNSNGTLDNNFGNAGVVNIGDVTGTPYGLELQPDGKLIVGGVNYSGVPTSFTLARYNNDGSLDTSFGQSGIATLDKNGGSLAIKITRQQNGKIIIGGQTSAGATLARLNVDGSLDTAFGNSGVATLDVGESDEVLGLALQPDGQIIAVGDSINQGARSNFVARFNGASVIQKPTGLTAVTPTNNAPVLTWDPVTMATSYEIYRQDTSTGTNVLAGTSAMNNFTDIYAPGIYNYTVVAVAANDTRSEPSDPFQVVVIQTTTNQASDIQAQGQSEVVPVNGSDILPGLTSGNNTKASFDFSLGYSSSGVLDVSRPLTLTFNTAQHDFFVESTTVDWLVVDGQNNSRGTFQGLANVTLDNVTTTALPYTAVAIDGALTDPDSDYRFKLTVYTDSSRTTVLYTVDQSLSKGKIKIN